MDKKQTAKRIEKLRKLIDRYRYEYHVLDKLSISEEALDSLKKELFDLEQKYPDLVTPDSPTQRVAGQPLKGFKKVTHPGRMISLNDAFNEQDFRDWKERLDNYLDHTYRGSYYCDIKMDGLAIELVYENGLLVQASTRGDGLVGEDVTHNVRTVDAVPLSLRDADKKPPKKLIVRGEVFITKSEFRRLNRALEKAGEKTYANPRNLAAGTVRQLDPSITAGRKLSFYAYSVVGVDGTYGNGFDSHDAEYHALRQWGIGGNPHGRVMHSVADVLKFHAEWERKRESLDYEFDGVVIAVNDNDIYRKAGVVGKAPRGAIAFKFAARQAETVVEDIQVQVGRIGALTPVAHLKPVHIGGTTITRATLHNLDEIERLGVKIGDTVIVGRAGDVIPDIIKVLPELRPKNAKAFHMPKKCPVCGVAIVHPEGQVAYVCPNRDCPAKRREAIYHFVSRSAMNMEGVGPQTIDQLMDAGLVATPADLYSLTKEDVLNLDRFAEVSAQNLIDAIQERKKVPLHRFIYALGIEHVGEETARVLAQYFHTLEKLREATPEELQKVPDIGPTVAASISEWFSHTYNQKLLDAFAKAGVHVTAEHAATGGKLSGKTFVVTGTLDTMGREEAEEAIRQHGGKVASAVSKETDYVVVGASPGATKMLAAKKYGTKILDEAAFQKMLH